ncbi:hypothetical protein HYV43_05740 [Candidatus Micrarchaeota archaeon]|nr:hypothetical protein [Candidatus Micrarchaeota archaeon]
MRVSIICLLIVFSVSASALSFSAYAFLFPPIEPPLTLQPCTAFLRPVALGGKLAQDAGFEQGVRLGQDAVKGMAQARKMAQWQDSPLFWGGANAALNGFLSVACHRVAAEALRQAVSAVDSNWPAVDVCIADLEHAGVRLDGPAKGLYSELEAERQSIENRSSGPGLGGRVADALRFAESAPRSDEGMVAGMDALVGPQGVLERQVSVCRDVARVLSQLDSDFSRLADEVDQRLQDGQRLESRLAEQKISLVPQYAFSLQGPSSYTRTGWVQSFPETLQQARQSWTDAQENRRKAEDHWNAGQLGFAERALSYAHQAREQAEAAATAWGDVDRQTGRLESDLLRQVDALRRAVQQEHADGAADVVRTALARQSALELADRPLPASRGERILQLADAVTALNAAQETARRPAEVSSRSESDRLKSWLDSAASDGLDVSAERSQLAQWAALGPEAGSSVFEALESMRQSVLDKAAARFGRLEPLWLELLPFSPFVSLPADSFDVSGRLQLDAQLGHLAALEKKLEAARHDVDAHKAAWLKEYLERRLELRWFGGPVVADSPANRSFLLSIQNDLEFGLDGPLLLKRPLFIPASARLTSATGVRLLPDGLLLEYVPAGGLLAAEGVADDVLVRTRSLKEENRYASPSVVRRAWVLTLDSEVDGSALWMRAVDYPVERLGISSGEAAFDDGSIKAVLSPLKKGVNVFHFEFDVPQPVRFDKTAVAAGWSYSLQSTVPFDLAFQWRLDEPVACTPESPDFSVAKLSDGLYRFSANVSLNAYEVRDFLVQLPCVPETLANQTAWLERLPALAPDSAGVLPEVRRALTEGRFSDATWLLFQLQNAPAASDPLEKYRALADDEDIRPLLERADAAWRRSDSAVLSAAVKELDAYVRSQKNALGEKIKAVCSRCPQEVESALHDAKAALFLSDLSGARGQLATAQLRLQQWQSEQSEANRSMTDLVARIRSASWPALARFESAWSVSEPALRWRSRQLLYSESKAHADALQAAVKQLQSAAGKAEDGKPVSLASVESDFSAAVQEEAALESLLDRLEADGKAALDASEKAVQQFGASSSASPLLDAIREAQSQSRFAAALYASEQLALQLQRAPLASVSPASGLLGSHSLLEVGAGLGGLLVLGGLAYWFKLRKSDEPELEEIG